MKLKKKTKKNELLEGEIEENNYSIKKEPKKINQVNLDQSIKLET
jgi:glycine cleavage system H lipoate-binding protein